jgi:hypothetical protein
MTISATPGLERQRAAAFISLDSFKEKAQACLPTLETFPAKKSG